MQYFFVNQSAAPDTVVQMEPASNAPQVRKDTKRGAPMPPKTAAEPPKAPPKQPSIKVTAPTKPMAPGAPTAQSPAASSSSLGAVQASRKRGVSPIPEERSSRSSSPCVKTPQPGGKSTVTGKVIDGWI